MDQDKDQQYDAENDLKKTVSMLAYHSASDKRLVDYKISLGSSVLELKQVFEKEFGTAICFQQVYIINKRAGLEQKTWLNVDDKTLLDYGFDYLPFSQHPGLELYILCEDKYTQDLDLKSKEAQFWKI